MRSHTYPRSDTYPYRFSSTRFGIAPANDTPAMASLSPSTTPEVDYAGSTTSTSTDLRLQPSMTERIASARHQASTLTTQDAFDCRARALRALLREAQRPQDMLELMAAIDPGMLRQHQALLFAVARHALAMTAMDAKSLESVALACLQAAQDIANADVQQAMWNTISHLSLAHSFEGAKALMDCLDAYADRLQLSPGTPIWHKRAKDALQNRAKGTSGSRLDRPMTMPSAFNGTSVPPPLPKELWVRIAAELAKGAAHSLLRLYSAASHLAIIRRLQRTHGDYLQGQIKETIDTWIRDVFAHLTSGDSKRAARWARWPEQQRSGDFSSSNRTSQYAYMCTTVLSKQQLAPALAELLEEAVHLKHYPQATRLPLNLLAVAQQTFGQANAQLESFTRSLLEKRGEFDLTMQRSILLNAVCVEPDFLDIVSIGLTDPQDLALARRTVTYRGGMKNAPAQDIEDFLAHMEATPVEQAGEPLFIRLRTLVQTARLDDTQQRRWSACHDKAVENARQLHLPWQAF